MLGAAPDHDRSACHAPSGLRRAAAARRYPDVRCSSAVAAGAGTSTDPEDAMRSEAGTSLFPLLGAVGLGAAAMYLLDPERGRRRRHLLADQFARGGRVAGDAISTTRRDLANRTRGVAATVRGRVKKEERDVADDVVIAERVRAELGRVVSHPGAIEVTVESGRVTLSGPVLEREADKLIARVRAVRGVSDVDSQLDRHEQAGNVPGLQGGSPPAEERFELMQANWTPAARLLTGVTGGALALYGLGSTQRRDALGTVLGLAGLALATRSATNEPFDRILGIGAGRRGVTVQKSINIAAPVDEVFGWLTEWENWPAWMSHVREVTASGTPGTVGERTHWVVDGPAGTTVSWDATTTRLVRPDIVSWKTVDGSPVAHEGTIRFSRNRDGSTRVDVRMTYNPIAGAAGHAVATLLGRDPKRQMDDDLARLKTTIETGQPPHDAVASAEPVTELPGTA